MCFVHIWVLLGTFHCFWVLLGAFWCFWDFLGLLVAEIGKLTIASIDHNLVLLPVLSSFVMIDALDSEGGNIE